MSCAIEAIDLTKYFPLQRGLRAFLPGSSQMRLAVERVSLQVHQGELFGLLGPNGAGKTTLIKMLTTLVLPSSGSARVNGYPLSQDSAIKSSIGLVTSDERSFYWRLSGRQNLEFFASLHGLHGVEARQRIQEALDLFDLADDADNRFLTYSTGIRQRLSIARSLLNRPSVLFLDEPTKGLDPTATAHLHQLIRQRLTTQLGLTVFLTTHDLQEAQALCDRIAIMHQGRLRACGTMAGLIEGLIANPNYVLRVHALSKETTSALQAHLPGIEILSSADEASDHKVELRLPASSRSGEINRVIDILRHDQVEIESAFSEQVSLETIFAHHTSSAAVPAPQEIGWPSGTIPVKHLSPQASPPYVRSTRLSPRLVMAFLKRDLISEASYPLSFGLQIISIFFSVGVFYFISKLIGSSVTPLLQAYQGDYFAFVLIGIAFASYFGVGLSSFASSLRQAQTTGTLEAMLATPASISAIVISSSLWDYVLTTLRVLVYLGLGVLLLDVDLGRSNYPGALVVMLLTISTFSSIGIIAASFVMVLKRGDPITWAFSSFSNLVGGVYYPITVLPAWLQTLAGLLPITYALHAMRMALLNGAPLSELLPQLAILALFSAILLPTSLLAFRYAVRRARTDGSLTHY